VHLGHQAMIHQLKAVAKLQNLKTVVMILSLNHLNSLKVMMLHRVFHHYVKKSEYLTELGVDYIAVAKFDNSFRSLSAEQFADILKENSMHKVWF
jgi:riboflavin kinase/FMN adenylyltransferase